MKMTSLTSSQGRSQTATPPKTLPHVSLTETEKEESDLREAVQTFNLGGTVEQGDTNVDRCHATHCVLAALDPPRGHEPGKLDFGDYNPACMKLPVELVGSLGKIAASRGQPVDTVVLPTGLHAMPRWLNALPDLKCLVVRDFTEDSLDLTGLLPKTNPSAQTIIHVLHPRNPNVQIRLDDRQSRAEIVGRLSPGTIDSRV